MSEIIPTKKVRADVRIVPAKRTASYDVPVQPIEEGRKKPSLALAKVNAKSVVLSCNYVEGYGSKTVTVPKTIYAVDALLDLLVAVRAELVEQGIQK